MISVIITTYNSTQLHHCVEGFRRQEDPPPFELIIVNDGGEPPKIAAPDLDLTTIDLNPPSSEFRLAAARNLGAKTAKYGHLVFTDQDCIPAPDFLWRHATNTSGLVAGCRRRIPMGVVPTWPLEALPWRADERLLKWQVDWPQLEVLKHCFGCNLGLPKRLFQLVEGFDERFVGWGFEDLDLAARLFGLWIHLTFDPRVLVYHLDHPRGPEFCPEQHMANRARYLRSIQRALQQPIL